MNTPVRSLLSNARLAASFGASGELLSLTDPVADRDYIARSGAEQKRPLFVLRLVELMAGEVLPGEIVLTSLSAKSIHAERSDERLELQFQEIDGLDLQVNCIIVIERDSPFLHFSLQVRNRTAMRLLSVEYPVLVLRPHLGAKREDDRILLPKEDGQLLGNPNVVEWQRPGGRPEDQRYLYPGEGREVPEGLSAQLVAYYDTTAGLYLATHDGGRHIKKLGPVWLKEPQEALDFTPVHFMEESVQEGTEIPYETVAGFFAGDWQDAADIYKGWARTQQWCARTTRQRSDIPDWVKKGAFFFCFRLRCQAEGPAFLEKVPEFLNEWKGALQAPLVAMMCGWEKVGEWTGPDYFPPYGGGERYSAMCEALKRDGIRPFPFGLSGLKLALRKKITRETAQPELAVDYDAWKEFQTRQKDSAVTVPGGAILFDSQVDAWDGIHAYACVSTEQARTQLHGASLRLVQEYGAVVVQADQVLCGSVPACYSTGHGHPAGRGRWQIDHLARLYDDTRRDCKRVNPEFALSQEWISEPFLQSLDLYHCRNYDEPRGMVGVPLFSYLYHEYIPCFGGDWSSFLSDNPCGVYYHAINFVNGNLPAGCPQTMWRSVRNSTPRDADPSILQMAKNASAAFFAFPQYFIIGEMLKTTALHVPTIEVSFTGLNFGWKRRPLQVPSVLHRGWRSFDGSVAYAFANISRESQAVDFFLPPHGMASPVELRWNRNGLPGELIEKGCTLPKHVKIELAPLEAGVLQVSSL